MTTLINEEIDTLLKDTSRSFFITLQALPSKIRGQIGLLYLLARIADTIADTKNGDAVQLIQALNSYNQFVQGKSSDLPNFNPIADIQEHQGEEKLLRNVKRVVISLNQFDSKDQERIQQCLDIIVSGQTLDLERFGPANDGGGISHLNNIDELDDYAYRVAGRVGEFWTKMSLAHIFNADGKKEEKLFANGVRFGKALQLINILRDIPEDLRFGRCYIPGHTLAEFGLEPSDLLVTENMEKFRPLYDQYLDLASSHLDAAAEYIEMLPYRQFRLRGACILPVLIGQRTISLLRSNNVLDSENRVKVLRPEINDLIRKTKRSLIIPGGSKRLLKSNRNH